MSSVHVHEVLVSASTAYQPKLMLYSGFACNAKSASVLYAYPKVTFAISVTTLNGKTHRLARHCYISKQVRTCAL